MTSADIAAEAAAIWRAERRERLLANLLAARPAEFGQRGPLNRELDDWAQELAGGTLRNLVITGPTGTGKTWALWHAAERAVRCGYEARIVITGAASLRRAVAPATADPGFFARCCTAGLLAVDDVGAFRLSEWDMDHLAELADSRWAAKLPTVITSNKTDIRTLLGPRISSRLAHGALVVELDGPDRRRQP